MSNEKKLDRGVHAGESISSLVLDYSIFRSRPVPTRLRYSMGVNDFD
ncbi:hypothetical protein F441_04549 [Phytophthora nicotianae CJ01A1]|uniref:Uncharacterized protein n=4 Tax=Phytophthora nicotianae TaxID=4792 RepID=W2QIY5_PHYN3|nr:hypothetical protein PPTG_22423 [Phytophthora nicotianae INRA-310]ETI52255.1 hypothetical protein F443_04574 [Phytophthora nicotianae P1569]ETL45523.1 hypothetical protein L916_04414 [Phytophthora nicotianae]ETP22073.1 hypothetical protein F441_04549 [Phytophthora nicotianae CJ01A1]ETL98708.1 hypothetical protein L917_04283 [Phytophthora nicotianae]ETN12836.1 hypothetical protein PPTG_22423 [Phytophthora nicotianae INRA-310]